MSVTIDCTIECERVVECTVCKRRKHPIGRDPGVHGNYCEHECPGHNQEPHPGHLWPGELARERDESLEVTAARRDAAFMGREFK